MRLTYLLLPLALCLLTDVGAEPLRVILEVDHDNASGAIGAPFPPKAGIHLEIAPGSETALSWGRSGRRARINPNNVSFARDASGAPRVVAFDSRSGELLVLRGTGAAVAATTRRVRELGGLDARGVALDVANDRLFVLAPDRVLILDGVEQGRPRVDWFELPENLPALGGLAFNPTTGHLLALASETGELLELTLDGQLVTVHVLPDRALGARAIAVAPSSDGSDAPEHQSLFVAVETPGGGSTLELSLEPLALAAATTVTPSLLATVLTSNYSPPSPDPSGIEVIGSTLLISDGEVDEMVIYQGANLFETTTEGVLLSTSDTTFYSHEPTGVAYNPASGHIFTSDDDQRRIWEVTPGADNRINSGDTRRSFPAPSGTDAEGIAFGAGSLWMADGEGAEVWRFQPGANGVFDGGGDDVITHFDTQALGLTDPEGIAYDTDGGNLYVVGEPTNRIAHISTSGVLLRWLDTTAAHPSQPAGLAYGPDPAGGPTRRLYVVCRGQDNDGHPNENDGKLLIFGVTPLASGNQPPSVVAGPDLATDVSQPVTLAGTVSDDGLPNPPGSVTTTWSQVSGPGTISFANANAVNTSATFSGIGTYVARLTASDTQLSAFDEVAITVTSSNGAQTVERRVATGSDDAEQRVSNGSVALTSNDLELVTDGANVQTVGVRFTSLPIPPGALIRAAWIQFQTDETSSTATSLMVQGEASDNAVTFASGSNNIGARPRTSASVAWSPQAWNVIDEAGAGQRTPDLAAVVQQIVNRGGWNSNNAMAFIITGSGHRVARAFESAATKAPLLHVEFGGAAGNVGPTVSAGSDASVPISQAASLDGTVSDDGLPNPPGTVTTTWSLVSGPGTVNFANAGSTDTTATFTAAGSYVLRLTANDSEIQASDDVVITVIDDSAPGNVGPTVSAGSDASVPISQAASLDGTVSDDGLPNPPGTVTTTWSLVSGPGTVNFANAGSTDTTATFTAAGSYVLRLTANDSAIQASDDVVITVIDDSAPGNVGPTVSAGSDASVPISQAASLDGTVSDDGLPNPPGTVTTTWSLVSGPGTVNFANAGSTDTTATFTAAGSYVLQLTANDSAIQASDDVVITVTAEGAAGTVERRISAGSDDAEQRGDLSMYLNSSDLELVTDGTDVQTVGVRFPSLAIPPGAHIRSAWIQFQTDERSSTATSVMVQGVASDNAVTFASGSNNIGARLRTSASVAWSPPAWNVIDEAGAAQRTPDLAAVVQEIVNRGGWSSDNAMAFIITGSGHRVARAFEVAATKAPLLHVEYGP